MPAGSDAMVSHVDIHRLACYLLEPPHAREHRLQDKPFSVWPPFVSTQRSDKMDLITLRLNWLAIGPPPVDALHERLRRTPHLGSGVPLVPVDIDVRELSFVELIAGAPATVCDVAFLSPTLFSRNGRRFPLPDPVVALSGLARRWNVLAGASDPAFVVGREHVEAVVSSVVVEACVISTVVTQSPIEQTGFVGDVRFALTPGAGSAAAELFAGMWRFASLAGVGRGTTYGLGAVEVTFPS